MSNRNVAESNLRRWRADPTSMVREQFKAEPDPWQHEGLQAFADPSKQRLAAKACKGPGKTAWEAWCAWNFLVTRPHPKVAATSITAENLSDNLWTEMAHWRNKSKMLQELFVWTKTRIVSRHHPETWWMSARSWPKSADTSKQADTLAGLHADHLLFILDEVGGIPDAVMAAAEAGLATGKETKIIMAGNPTNLDGPLWRACTTERHLWLLLEITGDPDDPKRSTRISKKWAREQIQKYGKDNPWVLVNVFGKFPPTSTNALISPDEVRESMDRRHSEDKHAYDQKRIGVDVAFEGDDRTVIFPRQGLRAFDPVILRNATDQEIASRVVMAKNKWGSDIEFLDGTGGWARGVVVEMNNAGHTPVSINFSSKADEPTYANKRAEMWFRMIEWTKKGGSLPDIPELSNELCAPTFFLRNGRFQIEGKDQIKSRLGYSPDIADALALTFAHVEAPRNMTPEGYPLVKQQSSLEYDYDPFDSERN